MSASAKEQQAAWAETVQAFAKKRDLTYEQIGGINPKGAPAALCPGGTNRITGQLQDEFWGASCDADEHEQGRFGGKGVLPRAVLVKAHMPDLAKVIPRFDVESAERTATDLVSGRSRRRVRFESVDFNKRFIATVEREHDEIALRELFSPAFIDKITRIDSECNFGITEAQLFFMWHLRELSAEELKAALHAAGGVFEALRREMDEENIATYPAGPWHAGLEPFPS